MDGILVVKRRSQGNVTLAVIVWVLCAFLVLAYLYFTYPHWCESLYICSQGGRLKSGTVKLNMFAIQNGIEQYASDHKGKYPASLLASDFVWVNYVPGKSRNPYDHTQAREQLVEENIQVDSRGRVSAHDKAIRDKRMFRAPGMVRYYVEKPSFASYAITGAGQDRRPLLERTGDPKGPNYVLHESGMGAGT